MSMDNEEYIRSKCDMSWSFEERVKRIEEEINLCAIRARIYARVLSTDEYKFEIKKKMHRGISVSYLSISYQNKEE